ncbi:MAG: aspartyl protease family protein [Bacteroidota bacterium]
MFSNLKHIVSLFILLVTCQPNLSGQFGQLDLRISGNQRRVEIPFRFENNFIVVPVLIQNLIPVNFIIDTGAEHTIILDRTLTDIISANYQREFQIVGSDLSTTITALLAVGIDMQVGDNLLARNRSVLVLTDHDLNFEGLTGLPIAGIIGGDFLMRFVMEIDYRKKVLKLHDPSSFKRPPRRFKELPSHFERNRPYLDTEINISNNQSVSKRLLMDSGASLSLLLFFQPAENLELPDTTILSPIANGLGGQLLGTVGRARNLKIGEYEMGGMIMFFQDFPEYLDSLDIKRDGLIGNRALSRYHIYIDYPRRLVYAQSVGRWPNKFPYDRSGLTISAGGPNLNRYQIINVVPGSPADEAGLKAGDFIRRLNGTPGGLLTLNGINKKLEGKTGKRIRILAERSGYSFRVEFRLRDII